MFASGILLGAAAFTWVLLVTGREGALAADPPGIPIVYVSRVFERLPTSQDTAGVARASSGRLMESGADGVERVLVDGGDPRAPAYAPLDVADPDASHDAHQIVFAGFSSSDGAWRIYKVYSDGSGLEKVTFSDRVLNLEPYGEARQRFVSYDDVDPCFLPDGRICFVSSRHPGVAPGNRLRATNLYVVNADGSDLHRITTERFGADTPTVDPSSGQIVYSRWWLTPSETPVPVGGEGNPARPPVYYGPVTNPSNFSTVVLRGIDDSAFNGVNIWALANLNPDGTGLAMRAGFGLNRELTVGYRPAFLPTGEMLSQFILESPILGVPLRNGLRRFPARDGSSVAAVPVALGGPQSFDGNARMPDPNPMTPARETMPVQFQYSSASALPGGRILVTGFVPGASQNDSNVYVQDNADQAPTFLFGSSSAQELDAVALVARATPPRIADTTPPVTREESPTNAEEAYAQGGKFTFKVENIFANGPVDLRNAGAPPMGRELSIEFYMNPQRTGLTKPDEPILLKTAEVGPDGKVEVELPAGVQLFEVLRRPDGKIALGRDGQAFHVGGMNFGHAGAVVRCVGCHSGHSLLEVPEDPSWFNIAPSAVVTATSVRVDSSGVSFVPEVLVDRLTDPLASEWAANEWTESPEVRLRWLKPIIAREVTIYGTRHAAGLFGERNQTISSFTLTRYAGDQVVGGGEKPYNVEIRPEGTRVEVDPSVEFDTLVIRIPSKSSVQGLYEGLSGAALSEVEVMGKGGAAGAPATVALVRGDTDCDGVVKVTDAIITLSALFRGAGPLCCDAAADVTDDGNVNLTDVVHLLSYLYLGGMPGLVTEECARVTGSSFTCDEESCP